MSYERFDMNQVKNLTNGEWDRIFAVLAPALDPALAKLGRHVKCPMHGGTDGFRLRKDSVEGHGLCNQCTDGRKVDGFELLSRINGWSFVESVKEALSVVDPGGHRLKQTNYRTPIRTKPPAPVVTKEPVEVTKKKMQSLRNLWMASISLNHPDAAPARRYFASRGLKVPQGLDQVVRFVPSHPYWDDGKEIARCPTIIARAVNTAGQAVTLHRTFLSPDGAGKANLGVDSEGKPRAARKMMRIPDTRPWQGMSVRLSPPSNVLAVTEGLETAWAVHELTGFNTWAALSTTFLEAFEPPEGVTAIWIFADKDVSGAGQEAAHRLMGALRVKGFRVTVVVPPWDIPAGEKSLDWNDVYKMYGRAALKMLEPFQKMARSIPATATVKAAKVASR